MFYPHPSLSATSVISHPDFLVIRFRLLLRGFKIERSSILRFVDIVLDVVVFEIIAGDSCLVVMLIGTWPIRILLR